MKLIAFKTYAGMHQRLVPASRTREWMDKTPEAFAYHCLPLIMANSLGWFILNEAPCELEWDGTPETRGIRIQPTEDLTELEQRMLPISHFGSGVVTFHIEYLFRTEEKTCLMTKGPGNHVKHGIQALEGVIETDWLPYPFTMNWKLTAKDTPVRFARGEPIAQIFPWPGGMMDQTEPEIRNLESDPELHQRYQDYLAKRGLFNENFNFTGGQRQKYYVRGQDSLGQKVPTQQHKTDWKVKPFFDQSEPKPDAR